MDSVYLVIAGVAPALVVFMLTALFLKKQGEKEVRNLQIELRKERQSHFLPARTDAYQRLILFLERIHPNALVMRLHNPGLPAKAFQAELVSAIRQEFDHNVAQQLYISHSTWQMIKTAKEETLKFINIAGAQTTDTALSTDLAGKIFELLGSLDEFPTEIVAQKLKAEFQDLL